MRRGGLVGRDAMAFRVRQKSIAICFEFFCYLNVIFLQDAAELLIVCPERAEHAMFMEVAVLRSPEFVVSYVGRHF